MSDTEINICKTMVEHLLSENTSLKKDIQILKSKNHHLEQKISKSLSNLNESWAKDYNKILNYSKNLEEIIIKHGYSDLSSHN